MRGVDDEGVQEIPARLFCDIDMETPVPGNHMLRLIDRFLDVGSLRALLVDLKARLSCRDQIGFIFGRVLTCMTCFMSSRPQVMPKRNVARRSGG